MKNVQALVEVTVPAKGPYVMMGHIEEDIVVENILGVGKASSRRARVSMVKP